MSPEPDAERCEACGWPILANQPRCVVGERRFHLKGQCQPEGRLMPWDMQVIIVRLRAEITEERKLTSNLRANLAVIGVMASGAANTNRPFDPGDAVNLYPEARRVLGEGQK